MDLRLDAPGVTLEQLLNLGLPSMTCFCPGGSIVS